MVRHDWSVDPAESDASRAVPDLVPDHFRRQLSTQAAQAGRTEFEQQENHAASHGIHIRTGRFFAVWLSRHGPGHRRGFPGDSYAGWPFADALADQSQQPTQPGGRLCRIARLGVALGGLGFTAWGADSDDRQGSL